MLLLFVCACVCMCCDCEFKVHTNESSSYPRLRIHLQFSIRGDQLRKFYRSTIDPPPNKEPLSFRVMLLTVTVNQ